MCGLFLKMRENRHGRAKRTGRSGSEKTIPDYGHFMDSDLGDGRHGRTADAKCDAARRGIGLSRI